MVDNPAEVSAPSPAQLIGRFISIDRIGALLGVGLVIVVNSLAVQEPGIWLTLPFLATLVAALIGADRALETGQIALSLTLVAAGNWFVAIAIAALLPFLWPVMVLTVIMPLLLATPYLGTRPLVWMTATGALVGGLVAIIGLLSDDGGVLPDVDDVVELVLVTGALVGHTVPMALIVWQQKQIQASALSDAERLNDELRLSETALAASQRRVVEASDEERSRIERDLHDGAQQRLVAARLRLGLLADSNDTASREQLDDLAGQIGEALDELRELAHGIYPPVLETGGVIEALAAVARRSPSRVELEATSSSRHDRTTETALYFTALEAMSNATKHAPDSTVAIRYEESDSDGRPVVRLMVSDDGPGFDPASRTGTRGLLNMHDRIRAVDGELVVESQPGAGTRLFATVPSRPR